MVEDDNKPDEKNVDVSQYQVGPEDYDESLFAIDDDIDILGQVTGIYQIWSNWAYFELELIEPNTLANESVKIVHPEIIQGTEETEFVYPIFDYGNRLSTSKASEMYSVGNSMCKLYYTIEKMIHILLERIKEGGLDSPEIESQISFDGHQLAQRKAFESIINLNQNVVVTNFDPGEWGEKYLQTIKKLADKGYGYPPEAPRDIFKSYATKSTGMSR